MKQKSRQKGVHIDHIESMSCHDIKHRRKINKLLYNYCRRGLAEKWASLVYTHYSTSPLCNTLVRVTFSPGARWIPHPIRKVCLKTAYNTKKQQVIIRCPVDTIHPQQELVTYIICLFDESPIAHRATDSPRAAHRHPMGGPWDAQP